MGSIPGWGRYPGVGNGNPLHYSWLENLMNRGATVHEVTQSWTQQRINHNSTHYCYQVIAITIINIIGHAI